MAIKVDIGNKVSLGIGASTKEIFSVANSENSKIMSVIERLTVLVSESRVINNRSTISVAK